MGDDVREDGYFYEYLYNSSTIHPFLVKLYLVPPPMLAVE